MPSSGMQYVQRKLQRSVMEMRRSRMMRPNGSTRSSIPPAYWRRSRPDLSGDADSTGAGSGIAVEEEHGDVGSGRNPVTVGDHRHGVGERRRRQLMAALRAHRADVEPAVVGEVPG